MGDDGPHVLLSRENKSESPAVVGVRKRKKRQNAERADAASEILVGDAALDNWPMAPTETIVAIRRLMGRTLSDPEVQKVRAVHDYEVVEPSVGRKHSVCVVMGNRQYSPIDISGMILKKAKEDAEFRLGDEVTHAAITVPAYFSQQQRNATQDAGLQAGLRVVKVLDEPTAIAIAFSVDDRANDSRQCILIYDLNGGAIDISVLMREGSVFAPLSLESDISLGEDNFDQVLIDHAVAYVKEEFEMDPTEDKRFMVELKKAAKATKEKLSSQHSGDLIVASTLRDEDGDVIDVKMEVTQAEYNRMIRPFVERASELVRKALVNVDLASDDVDRVLMAGRSTCIPLVQESMEQMFGKGRVYCDSALERYRALGAAVVAEQMDNDAERRRPIEETHGARCESPDPSSPKRECGHVNRLDAVACARCGADLGSRHDGGEIEIDLGLSRSHEPPDVTQHFTPFSYGFQGSNDAYLVCIQKGEVYPTVNPRIHTFFTQTRNQRMFSITLYGGDNMEKASQNEKQGEAFAVLPPGLPSGAPIRIRIWLDSDGVFDLAAYLEDGTNLEPVILMGEKDNKVVQEIEDMEAAFEEEALNPEKKARLEKVRNEAFDKLRKKDVDGAREQAAKLHELIKET